jgi:hypothetical protein
MKKFMLIATLMVVSLSASAQGLFLKPMAGGTVTTMTGDVEDDLKMKVGFTAGAELGYHFNNFFALTAGALYTQQGGKVSREGTENANGEKYNRSLDYLNVPILANVYIIPGLALKAGAQFGFLMRAKKEDEDVKDLFNNTDFSIPVGLSYEMEEAVIDLRYNIGLSNIAQKGIANIVDNKIRNSVIMLTIGYKIQL